jgi:preprotein translocase subunit YajC
MEAASLTSNVMQAVLQIIIILMFYYNRRQNTANAERSNVSSLSPKLR